MAKARKKAQHAEIRISSRKKAGKAIKKFYVTYHGNNSEVLAPSQLVKSLGSARKNIAAMIRLASGFSMPVIEVKDNGDEYAYFLTSDGIVQSFDPTLTIEQGIEIKDPVVEDTNLGTGSKPVGDDEFSQVSYENRGDQPEASR